MTLIGGTRALEAERLLGDALPVTGLVHRSLPCCVSLLAHGEVDLPRGSILQLRELRYDRLRRLRQPPTTLLPLPTLVTQSYYRHYNHHYHYSHLSSPFKSISSSLMRCTRLQPVMLVHFLKTWHRSFNLINCFIFFAGIDAQTLCF